MTVSPVYQDNKCMIRPYFNEVKMQSYRLKYDWWPMGV